MAEHRDRFLELAEPFAGRPMDRGQRVIHETVRLEPLPERDLAHYAWELSFEHAIKLRGRAIAREGEDISLAMMSRSEFEHYRSGDPYWVETRTERDLSIRFEQDEVIGEKALVVDAPSGPGPGPLVSVQLWRSSLFW